MLGHQSEHSEMFWKRQVYRRTGAGFRRFAGDKSGAVLVETAVVMAVLVPLLIGLTELSEALTLQRRVETAAATAADLVTRATPKGPITIEDLRSVGPILKEIVQLGENDVVPGYRIVSFTVDEQRNGLTNGSYACGFVGPSTNDLQADILQEAQIGDRIVLVETSYVFSSRLAWFIRAPITLRGTSYFAARIGNEIVLPLGQHCPS